MNALLASIPSPSRGYIALGPLEVRAYGVALGLAVLLAVWITSRRWIRLCAAPAPDGPAPDGPAPDGPAPDGPAPDGPAPDGPAPDAAALDAPAPAGPARDAAVITSMAAWAVPAGLIGARVYHVLTDFDRYRDNLGDIPKLWQGGLGIWGGISVGTLVGWWWLRRHGHSTALALDAVAPALAVAQAVGRLGNWFNQELYGRPTDLPWALEIDPAHRVTGYAQHETFHPTFAYEALWSLALAAALVWVAPKALPRLRTGYLFAVYVLGYTSGRVWIELLRIDDATRLGGVRINVWTSIAVGTAAAALLLARGLRSPSASPSASQSA